VLHASGVLPSSPLGMPLWLSCCQIFLCLKRGVVVSPTCREAGLCYERIAARPLFANARPLHVQFCSVLPRAGHSGPPPATRLSHVWVAGATDEPAIEDVCGAITAAGLPMPVRVTMVGGDAPGALLVMPEQADVGATADTVARHLAPERSAPPRTQGPGSGLRSPNSPGAAGAPGPLSLAPPGCTTLLLAGVDPSLRDGDIIRAAEAHGRLVGSRINRPSESATLEFASTADATRAAAAMHGALLGRSRVRVDWGPPRVGGPGRGGGGGPRVGPGPPHMYPGGPPPFFGGLPLAPMLSGGREGRWEGRGPGGGGSPGPAGPSGRWETRGAPPPHFLQQGRFPNPHHHGPGPHQQQPPHLHGGSGGPGPGSGMHRHGSMGWAGDGPPLPGPPWEGQHASPPAASAHQPPVWSGRLHKTNIAPFRLVCSDGAACGPPSSSAPGPPAGHPASWPPDLHVKERVPIPIVMEYWRAAVKERAPRGAWRLVADGPSDSRPLEDLLDYLQGKARAGVVKLPAEGPLPSRLLYLLVPGESLCRELGLPPRQSPSLLAVVLPHRESR